MEMKQSEIYQNPFQVTVDKVIVDRIWNGRGEEDEEKNALFELGKDMFENGQEKPSVLMRLPTKQEVEVMGEYENEFWTRIKKEHPSGEWLVVAGSRRVLGVRAVQGKLFDGKGSILVVDGKFKSLNEARDFNIRENSPKKSGQKPLTAIQKAQQVMRMVGKEGRKVKDVAAVFGMTSAWVSQRKSLIGLHPQLWEAFEAKMFDVTAALAYASMPEAKQLELWQDKVTKAPDIKRAMNQLTDAAYLEQEEQSTPEEQPEEPEAPIEIPVTQVATLQQPSKPTPPAAKKNTPSTGSVSVRSSREFITTVNKLETIGENKKTPELAILTAVRRNLKMHSFELLLKDLTKILNKEGAYAKLSKPGNVTKPTKASAA